MNPGLVTANSVTPLKVAAAFGNLDAVKLLLACPGIDVNWKDAAGRTAADIAHLFDNPDIVAALKEKDGSQTTTRQFTLTQAQLGQAQAAGQAAAVNKKDIIYAEKHSQGPGGAPVRAYWLTPYCTVAAEHLAAARRYENPQADRLRLLANTCQARIALPVAPPQAGQSQNPTEGLKVVALQSGKFIYPYWLETLPVQQSVVTVAFFPVPVYKMGIVAYFNAHDIDPAKPLEIRAFTQAAKEMSFKFTGEHGLNPVYSADTDDHYNW